MSRPLADLINDYEADPTQWDVVQTQAESSTTTRNKGGTSVQELLRHSTTGEEIVRHTLLRPNGQLFRKPHFRSQWK